MPSDQSSKLRLCRIHFPMERGRDCGLVIGSQNSLSDLLAGQALIKAQMVGSRTGNEKRTQPRMCGQPWRASTLTRKASDPKGVIGMDSGTAEGTVCESGQGLRQSFDECRGCFTIVAAWICHHLRLDNAMRTIRASLWCKLCVETLYCPFAQMIGSRHAVR